MELKELRDSALKLKKLGYLTQDDVKSALLFLSLVESGEHSLKSKKTSEESSLESRLRERISRDEED